MGSVGAPELLVIFLVALIVLGPERLPGIARQMGKAMAEFRRVTSGFEEQVRSAFDEHTGGADGDDTPRPSEGGPGPGAGAGAVGTATGGGGGGEVPDGAMARPSTAGSLSARGGLPATPAEAELPPPPDDPSRN